MRPQQVQIFSLGLPKRGTPKHQRRYRAKWRIDGRDKTRSFAVRAEAERLRGHLIQAQAAGQPFDPGTGFPVEWTVEAETWVSWSRKWVDLKWSRWSGNSRRSAVESLVALTPHLVRPSATRIPDGLNDHLRASYPPSADIDPGAVPERWLTRYSAMLSEFDPLTLEAALTAATTKRDGSMASAEVARRRRGMLNAVLRAAVRRGLLDTNPMDKVEWTLPKRTIAIDIATVPSYADVVAIVEWVANIKTAAARYAALFACVGMAGTRPSEAIHLRVSDLQLPADGWGLARLRGATVCPGQRYVTGDGVHEDKSLKQRADDEVRPVPLPPLLVDVLQSHLKRFKPVDGRVFTTSTGRPFTSTSYSETWSRARQNRWGDDDLFTSTTLYDLRHSAATLMLRAAVPPAEVARRLGHSVDVLMRVYAGVFAGERERSNGLIGAAQQAELNRDEFSSADTSHQPVTEEEETDGHQDTDDQEGIDDDET